VTQFEDAVARDTLDTRQLSETVKVCLDNIGELRYL